VRTERAALIQHLVHADPRIEKTSIDVLDAQSFQHLSRIGEAGMDKNNPVGVPQEGLSCSFYRVGVAVNADDARPALQKTQRVASTAERHVKYRLAGLRVEVLEGLSDHCRHMYRRHVLVPLPVGLASSRRSSAPGPSVRWRARS